MSHAFNIVGPGAVGLSLAAFLSADSTESDVATLRLIGKRSAGEILSKRFKVIHQDNSSDTITLPVFPGLPSNLNPDDWILVATKAYDLPEVLSQIEEVRSSISGTVRRIVVLCNGLGIYEKVQSALPQAQIVRGLVYYGARQETIEDLNTISIIGTPRIVLASEKASFDNVAELATLLRESRIEVAVESCVLSAEWQKAIVNTVVNSIATLLSTTNEGVLAPSIVSACTRPAYEEVLSVMAADGVTSVRVTWESFVAQVRTFGQNINSTLVDFNVGHRTEVDFFLGEVLRRAGKLGIKAPTLSRIMGEIQDKGVLL